MNCSTCGRQISKDRIDAQPLVVTCSRDCSAENSKRVRREAAQRWRDKTKAAKKKIGRRKS